MKNHLLFQVKYFLNPKQFHRFKQLILVYPKLNINIFLMPKVGTSMLKYLILEHMYPEIFNEGEVVQLHTGLRRTPNFGGNFSKQKIYRHVTSKQTQNFLFVRNPYRRLLSAYIDKIALQKKCSKVYKTNIGSLNAFAQKNNLQGETKSTSLPFDTFVRWVDECPHKDLDVHWALQTQLCYFNLFNYSNLYHIETEFSHGVTQLMLQLGADSTSIKKRLDFRINNTKQVQKNVYYTEELANIIYNKFRKDFNEFHYDRDSWYGL